MSAENRTRPIQMKFYVNERENAVIRRRMKQVGTKNQSAFIRKQVMDGDIIHVNYSQIKGECDRIAVIGNVINQIAKRVNSTGRIFDEDISELKRSQAEIIELIKVIDGKLL